MSSGIPKNQIKTTNTITQAEHEDDADAKRVTLVDKKGNFQDEDNPVPVIEGLEWNDLIIARDLTTQDITSVTYKKNGNVVRVLTLTYDANENLQEVVRT